MPPWKPPPPILQRPRKRTNLPNDWLGESTRHKSKLAILVVLSHDLTLQDYVPSVVRVALATRSHITTNVKTTLQIQINQQIDNQKYRWCVARPASPYQLIITRDAATLCIAVSAIVPPIQTTITNKIMNKTKPSTTQLAPYMHAPPIGTSPTMKTPTSRPIMPIPSMKKQWSNHCNFPSRPPA